MNESFEAEVVKSREITNATGGEKMKESNSS